MKPIILFILFTALFTSKTSNAATFDNDKCLRCHSSPTLILKEANQKNVKNLHVDESLFKLSNHKNLYCENCHSNNFYREWPHEKDTSRAELNCVNCHTEKSSIENPETFKKAKIDKALKDFASINSSFSNSLHGKAGLTCISCHNPHVFDKQEKVTHEKIAYSNQICLNCHGGDSKYQPENLRKPPLIKTAHDWLQNPELHLKNVRCIDCHTKGNSLSSMHNILSSKLAENTCENCHSQNSILLTKLYRFQNEKFISKKTSFQEAILNNSYIIGSTKNKILDTLSILIFTLTIAGIIGHSSIRYISSRKRNKGDNNES